MDIKTVIAIASFVIPTIVTIGTLVWKMAILHNKTNQNELSATRAHERINKLEDTQNNKIEELTKAIIAIKELQIRMEEKLNLLIKYGKKPEAK